MRSRVVRGVVTLAALVAASAAVVVGASGPASAATPRLQAFGITTGFSPQLMVAFKTDTPSVSDWVQVVPGLPSGNFLIGIDFRVQDGKLYGVDNAGNIYTIPASATSAPTTLTKVSQLAVTLSGSSFGVDFNPAADRLRVISDTGQNLRHNLNDHTTIMDNNLNQGTVTPARGVAGAAYTNNDLNAATATTLFDIDTNNDTVVIQSPPNNGSLVATGSLGFDVGLNAGFDMFSTLYGGKTVSNTAFASLTMASGGNPYLYMIDPLTANATIAASDPTRGQFPLNISDIAISLTGV